MKRAQELILYFFLGIDLSATFFTHTINMVYGVIFLVLIIAVLVLGMIDKYRSISKP